MNTEQERAFIEWRTNHDPRKYPAERDAFMAGWDAGRAALQSQDCEDAERINFIEANPGWLRVSRLGHRSKQMWACVNPFTNYEYDLFKTAREAIDHARRVEEAK